jgi:GNAT superfamily N-acetyltransferase
VASLRIRDLTPADTASVMAMIERAKWRARAAWLEFAASHPSCFPVAAEADGIPVGTGVGTASGPAGWLGTIFVDPAWRGRGLGRALTEAVIDRLETAGCSTLVLVATEEGRRLYERMGFEVQTRYHVLETAGVDTAAPPLPAASDWAGRVRAFEPDDLDAMATLDREATGEDRRHLLARFATPESTKVAIGTGARLDGFVVRAPWGGGATVARTEVGALAILDARRRAAGATGVVRLGVLSENENAIGALSRAGATESWSAPRMIRGAPLHWRPEWLWGQFNYALG